jgi:molybdate transport system regulatory protein
MPEHNGLARNPAAQERDQLSSPTMPTRRPTAAPTPPGEPRLQFRIRITAGDLIAVGPGKIALLEAIGRTGSLTAAAKSLDMSYRRAWVLLDQVNRSLRQPAVESAQGGRYGGGSQLTAAGRQLVELYRRIETMAGVACAGEIRELMALLAG